MNYYLRDRNTFLILDTMPEHMPIPVLPAGVYSINYNQQSGKFFLNMEEGFALPPKLYGSTTVMADRILSTFHDRPNSTGVLLSGEKGSGKTLLAKTVAIRAMELGMPVLIINAPWAGEAFNRFIQSINQPCVILFDEFEKVYEPGRDADGEVDVTTGTQNAMLTLLDGVYPSKKLFMLTANDRYKINQAMLNRPGRIYYALEFDGLDESFVREYVGDCLKDQSATEKVVLASRMFSPLNFDMLQAIVEELNRYGTANVFDTIAPLNVRQSSIGGSFTVTLKKGDKDVTKDLYNKEIHCNPMADSRAIHVQRGSSAEEVLKTCPNALEFIDIPTGVYRYAPIDGYTITLTKMVTHRLSLEELAALADPYDMGAVGYETLGVN